MNQPNYLKWIIAGIVLDVIILGLLGWVIYQQMQTMSDVDSLAEHRTAAVEVTDDITDKEDQNQQNSIEFGEWGLKSNYSQSDIKLKYKIEGDAVMLTEETLMQPDTTGQYCEYGGLGRMHRYSPGEVVDAIPETSQNSTTAEQYFENKPPESLVWKKLDTNYYMFSGPQAACINKNDEKLLRSIEAGKELTRNLELTE